MDDFDFPEKIIIMFLTKKHTNLVSVRTPPFMKMVCNVKEVLFASLWL